MTEGTLTLVVKETQPATPKRERTKRSIACNYCRLKKVKCNGEQPICANCLDRGEKCVYLAQRRRSRRESESSEKIEDRIARMEAILTGQVATLSDIFHSHHHSAHLKSPDGVSIIHSVIQEHPDVGGGGLYAPISPPNSSGSHGGPRRLPIDLPAMGGNGGGARMGNGYLKSGSISGSPGVDIYPPLNSNGSPTEHLSDPGSVQIAQDLAYGSQTHHSTPVSPALYMRPRGNSVDTKVSVAESADKSLVTPEDSDWEYHGPGSFLSICSKAGIDWVGERTSVESFGDIARTFSRDITRALKLESKLSPERVPEPDPKTAWQYCRTYFEDTPESAFDCVFRGSFESRLHNHFLHREQPGYDDDASWYALRNVVYAYGCRHLTRAEGYGSTFKESQKAGWRYFENALSRYTEMAFNRTSMMAVQALVAMAVYVEGVGCPSLEYMLVSSALRLAQSKGLHRQAGTAWGMGPQEIQNRNWIFWVAYTYEKHIAYRSGRASATEDDDISCQIPTVPPVGSNNHVEFCTHAFKHAQISSQIGKQLSTLRSYSLPPEEIIRLAGHFDAQLREWCDALPACMRPGSDINPAEFPPKLHIYHVIYLHYSYYGSLMAIHSIFTYPWSGMFGRDRALALRNQVKISTKIVAEASRNIILATKYIDDINAWTPVWLAFYYPVLGLINLFVHVLKHPTASSAASDIALMEVIVGQFGRLEFASSGQMSFSFAREIAGLARTAVKKAQVRSAAESRNGTETGLNWQEEYPYDQQSFHGMILQNNPGNGNTLDNLDMGDFDMENWSALVPTFSQEELMGFGTNEYGNDVDMSFLPT